MIWLVNNIRKVTSCTALEYVAGEITVWIQSHSFSDSEYQSDSKAKIHMDKLIRFCKKHSVENVSFQWNQGEED